MPQELNQQKCTPCSGHSPRLSEDEINQLKPKVPHWNVIEEEGELRLQRSYSFPNFEQALAFTQQVGEAAESEGHHPVLLTEWGRVTVTWWTHAIDGLHQNDFIMASKSDELARQFA